MAMGKTRLLVTASTFPRWRNDTEPRFIFDLCRYLEEYYDVTVLVPAAPGAAAVERVEGMTIRRFRYFPVESLQTLAYPGAIVPRIRERKARALLVPFLFLAEYAATRRAMKDCDVVLVNWFVPQGVVQYFLSRRRPYVVTGHGGDVTSLNFPPVRQIKQGLIDRAGGVVTVSEDLKAVLRSRYRHTDDVRVIPMGVDLGFYGPQHRDQSLRTSSRPIVLFVARMVEKKGTRYLLEAMKGIDARILLAGDGPERAGLERLAGELGLDAEFLGAKDRNELRVLYASCDVFAAPSVVAADGDKDGLPVVILEAMASGAPVIASDIAGIGEAVKDGENGILVPPKDVDALREALRTVLADPELRRRYSRRSLELARAFDYSTIAERYHQVLEQAMDGWRG